MTKHDELPGMLKAAKNNKKIPHQIVVFVEPFDEFTNNPQDAKSKENYDWCVENLDKGGHSYVFRMTRPTDLIHYIVTGDKMPFVFSFRYDVDATGFKLAWT